MYVHHNYSESEHLKTGRVVQSCSAFQYPLSSDLGFALARYICLIVFLNPEFQ